MSLHIEKVSGIFLVALTQVAEGKRTRNSAQQGATLTREDSEWSRKFEEPWQFEEWDWRGMEHVFLQGRVKGLAKTL